MPTCSPFRTDLSQAFIRKLDYFASAKASQGCSGTDLPSALNLLLRTSSGACSQIGSIYLLKFKGSQIRDLRERTVGSFLVPFCDPLKVTNPSRIEGSYVVPTCSPFRVKMGRGTRGTGYKEGLISVKGAVISCRKRYYAVSLASLTISMPRRIAFSLTGIR